MWQWWIILLNLRIHLPHLVTHNGLSNLLSLAALSVSLSAPNGSVISAVRVPLWILLTVLSARRRKCIYLYTGTEAHMLLGLRLNRFPLFWHDFGAVCQLYLQIRWNGFTSDTVRPSLVGCLSKRLLKAALKPWTSYWFHCLKAVEQWEGFVEAEDETH